MQHAQLGLAVHELIRHLPLGEPALEAALVKVTSALQPRSVYEQQYPSLEQILPSSSTAPTETQLSDDQRAAWAKLKIWVTTAAPYFVLRGFAGTGKTYLMQLLRTLPDVEIYYTAPTNKAAKVLSATIGTEAGTIYSLLGLRMKQDEDQLVLEPGDKEVYLPRNCVIVIDEASMAGSLLTRIVEEMREKYGCKVLYVGDPAQLPPVGESKSPAWDSTSVSSCRAVLKQVMRFDSELLKLSVRVRNCLQHKTWDVLPVEADNNGTSGVFMLRGRGDMLKHLQRWSSPRDFIDRKVIAWRNKTVERYNREIRKSFGFKDDYCVGDILWLASPIDEGGTIVATIDEEFEVIGIDHYTVLTPSEVEIPVTNIRVTDDQKKQRVLSVPKDSHVLDRELGRLAASARAATTKKDRSLRWRLFWETKNRFQSVRYGYAITAHRAQGSTYREVYVDQSDILANPESKEAFNCLYVAVTRATTSIYSF